jgi:hypothetical protein
MRRLQVRGEDFSSYLSKLGTPRELMIMMTEMFARIEAHPEGGLTAQVGACSTTCHGALARSVPCIHPGAPAEATGAVDPRRALLGLLLHCRTWRLLWRRRSPRACEERLVAPPGAAQWNLGWRHPQRNTQPVLTRRKELLRPTCSSVLVVLASHARLTAAAAG